MLPGVTIKRRQRTVAEAPQHPVADIDGANRRVAVGELQGHRHNALAVVAEQTVVDAR